MFRRSSKLLWFFLGFMGHSSLKSNLFTADEVCIQLLPFMIMPFMIFALSSCILLVLLIFPTLYHWGYSTNTDKKYLWHSVGGAGLSKDGTLLAKSNFYISHLRKLERPPDSIIWLTINTQPDHANCWGCSGCLGDICPEFHATNTTKNI